MKDILMKYMDQRYQLQELSDFDYDKIPTAVSKPLVTISREAGCFGDDFAMILARRINKYNSDQESNTVWKWMNKEILSSSARELGMDETSIKYIFKAQKKSSMDEILGALGNRYYKNDRIVRATIKKVVRKMASIGNLIIVGRAGAALTHHMSNALHIKLIAPFDWRVKHISDKHEISNQEAKAYVKEVDKKRHQLIKLFLDDDSQSSAVHDLVLNCKTLSEDQRLELVFNALKLRSMI